jgi:exosortase A-associated hydrolase 2
VSHTAFFLPAADGQRFCIHHPARGANAHGAVLYLHPFAEEMHKSRRMAALQSRALSDAGFEVLQIDLLGCGDSSGDFGDASWEAWIDDARLAIGWLRQRAPGPLWLWGLRVGGLLAADLAARLDEPPGLVLWNPVISGQQFLQQFLRLKLAASVGEGGGKAAMARIRERLTQGESVEVAGYRLSASMAQQIERTSLTGGGALRAVRWIETSTRSESGLSPAARLAVDQFGALCPDVGAIPVAGPAFWQSTEIEEAPALLPATVDAVRPS